MTHPTVMRSNRAIVAQVKLSHLPSDVGVATEVGDMDSTHLHVLRHLYSALLLLLTLLQLRTEKPPMRITSALDMRKGAAREVGLADGHPN